MLLRVSVFMMMAVGLVGFAFVAWFSLQPPNASASSDELLKEHILVASRDLRPGALLKPDDIGVQMIPQEKIPEGASPDTVAARHAMIGSMVRRPMTAGEVLLPHDILRPVERGFLALLERNGIRREDPTGQLFDPNLHQAMAEQESVMHKPGTVVAAWTPVWTLHGRLLRPAMVVLAKAPQSEIWTGAERRMDTAV